MLGTVPSKRGNLFGMTCLDYLTSGDGQYPRRGVAGQKLHGVCQQTASDTNWTNVSFLLEAPSYHPNLETLYRTGFLSFQSLDGSWGGR